jgi:hypothetical protein
MVQARQIQPSLNMETSAVVLDTSPQSTASVDKKRNPREDDASLSSAHSKEGVVV